MAAEVLTYDNVGMLATSRCDSCGAQAYAEVSLPKGEPVIVEYDWVYPQNAVAYAKAAEMLNKSDTLLFCANHYRENGERLRAIDGATIADHTPFLLAQESGVRDAAAAPK